MISLIAAFDPNMCIGKGDDLPWHYPEDLKYFRAVTLNHRVLMGRKTFLSIIKRRGRPLSGRVNLVASRNPDFYYPGIVVIRDLDAFLKQVHDDEIFVIGGYEIYKAALPYCDRLYLTHIKTEYPGDVYFPRYRSEDYRLITRKDTEELSFCVYERIKT